MDANERFAYYRLVFADRAGKKIVDESGLEMRYYLDTNILYFMLVRDTNSISADVQNLIDDPYHILYTSTVAVHELIHIFQIGRVRIGRHSPITDACKILSWLEDVGVVIRETTPKHLLEYSNLPIQGDHRDPNDRLIIAHAIADRVPLISSDRKFSRYRGHGLNFVFNER